MKISVQLYSLREEIKSEGLEAVLNGLRECGACGVETVADNYGLTPEKFKATLDKYGLAVTGSHTGFADLVNHASTLERSKALGIKNHIIPWLSVEEMKTDMGGLLAKLKSEIAFYKANGMTVGYHNHSHEFDGGADYIAGLLKGAPGLMFEPDIFWLAAAGKSAAGYIRPYEKRLVTIHLKELDKRGADKPNPLFGGGISEIKQCVKLALKLKLDCVVIELEGIAAPSWRDYIKQAVDYIHKAE